MAAVQGTPSEIGNKGGDLFCSTQWSLVLSWTDSKKDTEKAQEALAQLCRVYWRPVFAYFCRSGRSTADAQDLTQDFFVHVLKGNLFGRADRERGKFRALLLTALKNFATAAYHKSSSLKRGGGFQSVPWDDWMEESPTQLCMPPRAIKNWSPEKVYDYRWAATVVEQALRRLAAECEARGRRRLFETVSGCLMADRVDVSYGDLAKRLGVTSETVKRLLHQMRERFRLFLREEVARTMSAPTGVDEELRYLCSALAAEEQR